MRNIRFGLKVLSCFLGLYILSQNIVAAPILTLAQAYSVALSRNESIQVQQQKIDEAQARYQEGVSAAGSPYVGLVGSQKLQGSSTSVPEYKVAVKQPLFDGLRDQDSIAALKSLVVKEQWLLIQAKRELALQIATAYFSVLQLEKDVQNLHMIQGLAMSRLADLRQRVRLGKSRQSDILSSEAQVLGFKAQEAYIQGQLTAAEMQLENLMGGGQGPFNTVDITYSTETAPYKIETRADLQAIKQELESLQASALSASHGLLPNLAFGANYYVKRTDALDPINWDMTLSGEWPLLSGIVQPGMAIADSLVKQIESTYALQLRQVTVTLKTDEALLQASLAQKSLLEEATKKLKQSYDSVQNDYVLGLVNNQDVLTTLSAYLESKRSLDASMVACQLKATQIKLDKEEPL